MTFPSLICFSLAAAAALSGAALQGKVELLDAKKKGSAEGVVVWLEPVNGPASGLCRTCLFDWLFCFRVGNNIIMYWVAKNIWRITYP